MYVGFLTYIDRLRTLRRPDFRHTRRCRVSYGNISGCLGQRNTEESNRSICKLYIYYCIYLLIFNYEVLKSIAIFKCLTFLVV